MIVTCKAARRSPNNGVIYQRSEYIPNNEVNKDEERERVSICTGGGGGCALPTMVSSRTGTKHETWKTV